MKGEDRAGTCVLRCQRWDNCIHAHTYIHRLQLQGCAKIVTNTLDTTIEYDKNEVTDGSDRKKSELMLQISNRSFYTKIFTTILRL